MQFGVWWLTVAENFVSTPNSKYVPTMVQAVAEFDTTLASATTFTGVSKTVQNDI